MAMRVRWGRALVLCAAVVVAVEAKVPFWGATTSRPLGTDPKTLAQGEWIWDGDAEPRGPMLVIVSLNEQRAYVYRNGVRIGVATASTGKPGYETPTGVFTILQKDEDHRSKTYDDAPMPYQERLTWGGVALHAGGLPGYPSSHGCVHLPSAFARKLFEVSPMGMTVVIAEEGEAPRDVVHPGLLTPVAANGATLDPAPRLEGDQAFRWTPVEGADGPVSLVVSGADQRLLVYRSGFEVGRARVTIRDAKQPLGTHVFQALDHPAGAPMRWKALAVPGYTGTSAAADPAEVQRIVVPGAFLTTLTPLVTPGTTLLVTDAAVLPSTTGVPLQLVTDGPPPAG
ncbi:MAG: L,D-transpeptidase [bacterium]|nr:L,D-transpeptidase [bacterium]